MKATLTISMTTTMLSSIPLKIVVDEDVYRRLGGKAAKTGSRRMRGNPAWSGESEKDREVEECFGGEKK